MEELNVTVTDGVKELVIRKGDAPKVYDPKIVSLSGTITAPRLFNEKRNKDHKENKCNVVYSKTAMHITATFSEDSYFSTVVKGELLFNPDLNAFGINNPNKKWQLGELRSFLRLRRAFFYEREKNMKLIENLSSFKAKIDTEVTQASDSRGNLTDALETKVKGNLDLSFTLQMPIFKGQPDKKFKVEICFDVRERQVDIWLESPELAEFSQRDRDSIFESELKTFTKYVCIEQ